MNELSVIYRAYGGELTPETFKPGRPAWFDKVNCYKSFYDSFAHKSDIYVVWDGDKNNRLYECIEQTKHSINIIHINENNNQKSLAFCLKLCDNIKNKYVYGFLSEDDHFYLPNSRNILLEGLKSFHPHFIALGDHAHRYVINNGDIIKPNDVYITKSSHWRVAESYVFSFGFSMETFGKFFESMMFYNNSGHGAPRDRDFFRNVIQQGYRLLTPIPGCSTHMINGDMSPVVDWENM